MNYEDLNIHQKITLKGIFSTDPECIGYKSAMIFYGFVVAINWFLTDDFNFIARAHNKQMNKELSKL